MARAPWVKLCGLRTVHDVEAAVAAGADALGFVLAPSVRQIDEATAARLLDAVPVGILAVAVTRHPTSEELALVERLPFDLLQGDATFVAEAAVPYWPVFPDGPDLALRIAADPRRGLWGTVLVDGPRGGGRGEPADWDRVGALGVPVCLAGGLHSANVAEAIRVARPVAVDVSSGIEGERGRKDAARMRAFVAATRSDAIGT